MSLSEAANQIHVPELTDVHLYNKPSLCKSCLSFFRVSAISYEVLRWMLWIRWGSWHWPVRPPAWPWPLTVTTPLTACLPDVAVAMAMVAAEPQRLAVIGSTFIHRWMNGQMWDRQKDRCGVSDELMLVEAFVLYWSGCLVLAQHWPDFIWGQNKQCSYQDILNEGCKRNSSEFLSDIKWLLVNNLENIPAIFKKTLT